MKMFSNRCARLILLAVFGVPITGNAYAQSDLPSIRFESKASVTPASAFSTLASEPSPTVQSVDDPRVLDLADAYEDLSSNNEFSELCQFAQNHVRLTPYFGVQKGAVGAIMAREGTAFDQAQLVVDTYRALGGGLRAIGLVAYNLISLILRICMD